MNYHSILFPYGKPEHKISMQVLKDLRMDTVLKELSNGPDQLEYETCYLPLHDIETVIYRHEIFKDLLNQDLRNALQKFQDVMDEMYHLADHVDRLKNVHMQELCLVENARIYCKAMLDLYEALCVAPLHSKGLIDFKDALDDYVSSERFLHLEEHSFNTTGKVHRTNYILHIKDHHIDLKIHDQESDLTKQMYDFFLPYLDKDYHYEGLATSSSWELNPVQEDIVHKLQKLAPEPFSSLAHFMRSHSTFIPKEVTQFHEDLGFYLVWMDYYASLEQAGLPFCFPEFTRELGECISYDDCYDLILAKRCIEEEKTVIRNHICLEAKERIMVLTGPNQGGKTTYTRMIGQLFYLASLGVPVPGTSAHLFLPDQIFTHFERQEAQISSNGKLRDDIVRIHDILMNATDQSLILINEMFASTTLEDARLLGIKILHQIQEKGSFCIYVTFINALAQALPDIVSLISEIGEDGESRTYHIVRGPANGRAYAQSIVKKYHLTYDNILERIGRNV